MRRTTDRTFTSLCAIVFAVALALLTATLVAGSASAAPGPVADKPSGTSKLEGAAEVGPATGVVPAGSNSRTSGVAPVNDDFADARSIDSLPYADSRENTDATVEAGEPATSCGPVTNTIWYRFAPGANVVVDLDTFASTTDTIVTAYEGTLLGSLSEVACDDDTAAPRTQQSEVFLHATGGHEYRIQIGSYDGSLPPGAVAFHAAAIPRVRNDRPGNAQVIHSLPFHAAQDNRAATADGEPIPGCGNTARHTLWFRYRPDHDMLVFPDAHAASDAFASVLAVYRGRGLAPVECHANGYAAIHVTAGTTYFFQVGAEDGIFGGQATGTQIFDLHEPTVPLNDDFADALPIGSLPVSSSADPPLATLEDHEPTFDDCGAEVDHTVWYRFTPATDVAVDLDTSGSAPDTVVTVFEGTTLDTLTEVACDDDSQGTFQARAILHAVAGHTYSIQVGLFVFENPLPIELHATAAPPVPNDLPDDASVIGSLPYHAAEDVRAATTESEPSPSCAATDGHTMWFRFTPDHNMVAQSDVRDSSFPNRFIAAYRGPGLTPVDCSLHGILNVQMAHGRTYYFQVGGFSQNALRPEPFGTQAFRLSAVVAPPNDRFAAAQTVGTAPLAAGVSTVTATTEHGEPMPSCGSPSMEETHRLGHTLWYRYAPDVEGSARADFAADPQSPFRSYVAVYSGTSLADLVLDHCSSSTSSNDVPPFHVQPGTTYWFQVGGADGDLGDATFSLLTHTAPSGDDIATARPVQTLPFTHRSNNDWATKLPSDPEPTCAPIGSTLWYRYTAPADETVRVRTIGSDFDTVVGIYTGPQTGPLAEVACDDERLAISDDPTVPATSDSSIAFKAAGGETYWIQVGGYRGTFAITIPSTGNLRVRIDRVTPPVNDDFANALDIGPGFHDLVDTSRATHEAGEPNSFCDFSTYSSHSVWYHVRQSELGYGTIDISGTDFLTSVAIYQGSGLGDLQEINCGPDRPTWQIDPDTDYWIQGGGFIDSSGHLHLRLEVSPTPPAAPGHHSSASDRTWPKSSSSMQQRLEGSATPGSAARKVPKPGR